MTLAAAALLWMTAAQTGPAAGGTGSSTGADQAPAAPEATLSAPPGMSNAIPGTMKTRSGTTTAGIDLALSAQVLTQSINLTGGTTPQLQTGLLAAPLVGLGLTAPRFGFSVAYNPQFYLVDISQGPLDIMHRGWILAEWKATSAWRIYLAERLSYGNTNLATPTTSISSGGTGQQPPQLAPTRLASLLYENNDSSVGTAVRLSKALKFSVLAGYVNSGGIGTAAEQVMPHQQGPRAEATLDYQPSAASTLGTALAAQANYFSVGRDVYVATLAETWRVRLSRETSAWIIGGLGATNTDATTGLAYKKLDPIAALGMESGTKTRLPVTAFLQLMLAPYVDPYLAVAYQRLTLDANITWRLASKWAFGIAANAALVPYLGQVAQKYGSANANLAWSFAKDMSVSFGGYWMWQLGTATAAANFNQWGAYVSVSVADFEHI
ncbi:MAG TPA: hypothetical protein VMT17_18760 [Anaeromyxobacteraceae bacterium]|nr:hypothetical protein [Anaeromyxobacteraceae bacterium]